MAFAFAPLPADGHVHLGAADDLDLLLVADALRVGRLAEAAHAHRRQLHHVLGQGNL